MSRRALRDRWSGAGGLIVGPSRIRADPRGLVEALRVTQPIRRSRHWEGKLHNLRLASRLLEGVTLAPGEIFSFWALVGPPTLVRGFAIGRAIRADRLGEDVGGGLCQISGLAYEMGLRAGMAVIERHPHSRDLYEEATRFTPLGFDATIVWGHKDLRLRNTANHPLAFAFEVTDAEICGHVFAETPMIPSKLEVEREDARDGSSRTVRVRRIDPSGGAELVSEDVYAVGAMSDCGEDNSSSLAPKT